jgi:hypothetical protein
MPVHEPSNLKVASDGAPDPRAYNLTKAAYSINDLLEIGSDRRTALYAAIKAGKLRIVKCGRKSVALAPDYAAYLASLPQKTG